MKFDLSPQEVGTIQRIWHSLDLCTINKGSSLTSIRPKGLVRTASASTMASTSSTSSTEIEFSNLKFNFYNIQKFHDKLMTGYEDHDIYLTEDEIDIIDYQFDQIIQLMTLIVLNLNHLTNNVLEVLMKFSKINNRIYRLNLSKFGQLLMVTLLEMCLISNFNQTIFLDFLNQFFNMINEFSPDPYLDPIIDVNDYRLSLSDSNLSNLSLNNVNDLDVNSNLDIHSNITVDQTSLKIKPSFNPSSSSINNSVASYQKHLRHGSLTKSPYFVNGDSNSINIDLDTPRSIDIDQLDELTDDLDGMDSVSTTEKPVGSDSDEFNDDTFDLLNSFSAATVNNSTTKKLKRRLSSINLKASKNNLNLSKVSTNTSRNSKQECTIM